MNVFRKFSRSVSAVLAITVAGLSLPVTAHAGMVGTPKLLEERQNTVDHADLAAALDRADVQARLAAMGVDVEQAKARVSALTDDEVRTLNAQMEQLPAGGDILGVAVLIFLVLLATDILGYTDVFPFVKKSLR